jgi:hypothetical protein
MANKHRFSSHKLQLDLANVIRYSSKIRMKEFLAWQPIMS